MRRLRILCAFFVVGLLPISAHAFEIFLGTGEPESFSHFTGRTVCRIINRQTLDINCQATPASDDVDTLTNLQGGSLDIALVDSRMLLDAVSKNGEFKFLDIRYDNLRALLPLYDVPVALVARSDAKIGSLDELKGKRVNAGAPRSPQHRAVDTIMTAKGWSTDDFSLFEELSASHSQDTMAFCHGNIQAMVHLGVHPDSSLQQLLELCEAEFVDLYDADIEKLVRDHPALFRFDITAHTYPLQTKAVATFGTRAVLVASQSLDDQTVYQIIEALDSQRDRLKNAHPALAGHAADGAWKDDVGIPLHAGAVKYFSEK